ncbi:hypothetical protein ACET3Z_017307 [Daucus carota]
MLYVTDGRGEIVDTRPCVNTYDCGQSSKNNEGKDYKLSKSDREKLKRENLNDLFLALANTLEISEQTHGKACVLGEATRMVTDILRQIQCLKREKEALLSEFQYVTSQNNELQMENSAMQDQIEKLQKELKENMSRVNLDLSIAPFEPKELELMPFIEKDHTKVPIVEPLLQPPAAGTPLYVIRVCPNFPVHHQTSYNSQLASRLAGNVSKPHARYPSRGDSWPSRIRKDLRG